MVTEDLVLKDLQMTETQVQDSFLRAAPFLSHEWPLYAHSTYSTTLVELGLIGLLVVVLLHVTVLRYCVRAIRAGPDREARLMGAGLLGSFVAFLILMNVSNMTGSKYGWSIIALAGALTKVLAREREVDLETVAAADPPERSPNR